jgi:hypothetical protein
MSRPALRRLNVSGVWDLPWPRVLGHNGCRVEGNGRGGEAVLGG